jgi:hypothetical protein
MLFCQAIEHAGRLQLDTQNPQSVFSLVSPTRRRADTPSFAVAASPRGVLWYGLAQACAPVLVWVWQRSYEWSHEKEWKDS